ncbi:MAG: cellulase family glycosylhydrolase [Lachnospiraceae bacterium]|nr:cellulase family glycosylhydrolase [Lachnospiraceae bacterium]
MKLKKIWKYLAAGLVILCIGIVIGILIGMPIGETKGRHEAEDAYKRQEQEAPDVTEGVRPTETPEDGKPTDGPEGELQPTATVSPTNGAVPTKTPEGEVLPTGDVTPTTVPVEGTTPTPTPEVTTSPEVTATPDVTGEPNPTESPKATEAPKPTNIPTAKGEDGYYGRLHVEGTYLADKDDKLVQLRGVSTHGLGWFPQYVNEAAIRQFNEEWGCNVFRLAMYTAEGAGYCTNGDDQKQKLKDLVHKGVQAAIDEDMYVIIDWHILQDQDPNKYKDEAKKFFEEMAKTYKDDPHVIYEICNEPNGGTSWSMIKKYALEVIPVIRKYAPNAIIIVGTPTWSQDVDIAANDPITEYDNVMYALHFYAATHTDSLRNKCKTAVKKGLPIFVTEYGICEASGNGPINEKQAKLWIEMLDGYGISHVMWNLANKNETSSMIAAGNPKVNGFTEKDLSKSGKWFVNMLKDAGVGIGSALSGTTEAGQGDDTAWSGDSSGGGNSQAVSTEDVEKIVTAGDGVVYYVTNSWYKDGGVGVQLSLNIENNTEKNVSGWERKLTVKNGAKVEVDQFWSCSVSVEGNVITVTPADYNRNIVAGGSVGDVGIILNISE